MTYTEFLLFAHVLVVSLWVGTGFALNVLIARGKDNPQLAGAMGPELAFFGTAVFGPLSVLTLVTGALLVAKLDYDWTEPFILVGLFTILATLVMGPLWMGRNSAKLRATIAEHGPTHADVPRLKARLRGGAIFLLVLLLVTLFMMVIRPG
jgi:hypothetical protein